jgi:hypothetical protein
VEGFWPVSDRTHEHARATPDSGCSPSNLEDITPQDNVDPFPYCGPAKGRPRLTFNPYRDVLLGDFVLCQPIDNHYLPVWLGRVLECVDLTQGPSYGNFKVEWWIPFRSKTEGKSVVARECWTRRWQKELCLSQVVNASIVLFSHGMLAHAKKWPPATQIILEASVAAAFANLQAAGALMEQGIEDEADDLVPPIGRQPIH